MNTHHPDDERLPGEDELAALYRKLPHKEPSPALDAAVLRAAAQAVQPARRRRARWPVALGSAAALVLAAGLGWRMREMPVATAPSAAASVTILSADRAAIQATPAKAKVANTPAEVAPVVAEQAPSPSVASESPTAPSPPALPSSQTNAPAMKRMQRYAAAPAVQAAPRAEEAQAVQEQASNTADVASYRAATVSGEAMKAKAAPALSARIMAAPMPAPAAPIAEPAPPAPPSAIAVPDTIRDAADTPAQEIEKIRRLLGANQRDQARQRLADLHRDHPDYPLPDDLRSLLLTP